MRFYGNVVILDGYEAMSELYEIEQTIRTQYGSLDHFQKLAEDWALNTEGNALHDDWEEMLFLNGRESRRRS